MKIIALFKTSRDDLLVTATRSPDLLRRDLSKADGGAHLMWCGIAPAGKNAKFIADELHIAAQNGGISGFWAAYRKIYFVNPLLEKLKIRIRRFFPKIRVA